MRWALTLILVGLLAAGGAAAQTLVRLRPFVRVTAAEVTLGDVASVSGPEAALRALRAVVVAERVRPGGVVQVSVERVRALLREAGFDLRTVTVTGAPAVTVRRDERTGAVLRGSAVRVVAAVGAVRVSTSGVALEAGDPDDVVRVRVLATRKEVLARVVQPGLVTVVF